MNLSEFKASLVRGQGEFPGQPGQHRKTLPKKRKEKKRKEKKKKTLDAKTAKRRHKQYHIIFKCRKRLSE